MDVKHEQCEFASGTKEQHWFDVPIVNCNNPDFPTFIKQEIVDDVSYTFENPSSDLTIVKSEIDLQEVDLNDVVCEDTILQGNRDHPQPGCSYVERKPVDQVVSARDNMDKAVTLISTSYMSGVEDIYNETHIDKQDIKTELNEHNETITNSLDTVKCNDVQSSPELVISRRKISMSNKKIKKQPKVTIKSFQCNECMYSCSKNAIMKRHQMIHSGEKPYKCDECNYSCTQSTHMKSHKMTHSGEKPLKCDECNFSCIQSHSMKSHKMTHSGERPFKCNECNYSCIQFYNMKSHKMTHSGEKPYKCDFCNFSCIHSSNMKYHKMTHSAEKSFKCVECSYSCTDSGKMKIHKMMHSKEKPLHHI